ncbi:MAG: glutathione S-transferase family protein [Pseudomonadota bacterium]
MKLYIGNKNYSSWSFRPWIGLKMQDVAFEEVLVPFEDEIGNPRFKEFSPTGKVPCLVDRSLTVWESLAILEYAADKFPEKNFWPSDMDKRAVARAVAHEMHGGFGNLRTECPMNMRRDHYAIAVSDGVRKDVSRIEQLWDECLQNSGGPFLFGGFSNADAMFAPVVNRLEIYCLSTADSVARYTKSMQALVPWQEWDTAGRAEPWIVEADEA